MAGKARKTGRTEEDRGGPGEGREGGIGHGHECRAEMHNSVDSVTGEHVPYIVDSVDSVGSVGTCAALRAGF